MTADKQISVSEYLSTSYDPDCEYVDGEIVERNLGEFDHSRLQIRLGAFFVAREKSWGICTVTEQRVQVKPSRFRIPDVCVTLASAPREQIYRTPPFLCIEILSKDDTMSSQMQKIRDYLEMGIAYVWFIDPQTRRGYVYTSEGMHEAKDGVLRTADPTLEVPLAEIFD